MQSTVIGHANDEGTPSLRFARYKKTRVSVRWKGFILAADKAVLLRILHLRCRRQDKAARCLFAVYHVTHLFYNVNRQSGDGSLSAGNGCMNPSSRLGRVCAPV